MKQVASTAVMLVSLLVFTSTLKIEAICSSETSFDFQQTIRRYNRCENIKFYIHSCCWWTVQYNPQTTNFLGQKLYTTPQVSPLACLHLELVTAVNLQ
jgi:hypothetical protein